MAHNIAKPLMWLFLLTAAHQIVYQFLIWEERATEDGVNDFPGELSEEWRQKEVRGKQDAQKSSGRRKVSRGVGRYRENDILCLGVEM